MSSSKTPAIIAAAAVFAALVFKAKTTSKSASSVSLKGVHPDLVRVVKRAKAISPMPFVVTSAVRTPKEQAALSDTVTACKPPQCVSKHTQGRAVDVAPTPIDWNDHERFKALAPYILEAARLEGVKIKWLGRPGSIGDVGHYELV